jgi:hypothetical protein
VPDIGCLTFPRPDTRHPKPDTQLRQLVEAAVPGLIAAASDIHNEEFDNLILDRGSHFRE